MKRNEPPRQLDDTRALGLRGVNATEDGEYSTHGVSLCLSIDRLQRKRDEEEEGYDRGC